MRVLKEAILTMKRSPFESIGSVVVLSFMSMMMLVFAWIFVTMSSLLNYVETQPEVTVFFTDKVTDAQIEEFAVEARKFDEVKEVRVVSKESALSFYKQNNQNDPKLTELVTADILPASLEISAKSMTGLKKAADYFKSVVGVDEVVYQQGLITSLTTWIGRIKSLGMIISSILVVVAMIVTSAVISLHVSNKRSAITTMQLLGATPWFVRWPFLVEGLLFGLIGGIVAMLVVGVTFLYLTPIIVEFLGSIKLDLTIVPFIWTGLSVLAMSAGFGLLSGMLSTFRFSR